MRTRLLLALLCSAVLLAGCSSAVAGTATAPAVPSPGLLDTVDLADVDDDLTPRDAVALDDGSFLVLLAGDTRIGRGPGSALVELVPGADGLAVGTVTAGAPYAGGGFGAEVHVADDGTVVTVGPVLSGDGGDDEEALDVAFTVQAPGAEEPELRVLPADPQLGTADRATAVLSPDGRTLYAALRWYVVGGDEVTRLAAVDVATGTVTASADLQVAAPGGATVAGLALRPDGGLVALVTTYRAPGEGDSDAVLAEYDAGLRLVGAPVDVIGDGSEGHGHALQVLADGTAVVSLSTSGADHRLVTVRDGAVLAAHALPHLAAEVAVSPDGRVWLNLGDGDVHTVAPVDLATGEVGEQVILCEDRGAPTDLALSADGGILLASGVCAGADVAHLVG
ncbi:hypothetical protein [Geodermatophilus nigrescens]|uniref:Lactonase, 7-bladed beta-propeller n=1 Tax=Geodermatophilus nigrescens TaxID=1070870 RepID=A0A1M5JNJ9_9ACTN|nr:hypothetical protein [Geodermatophilus nigrescens]SHG42162.1 hypothetical protein SAMN05444351_2584 [Geodermatophilus nigrescens]